MARCCNFRYTFVSAQVAIPIAFASGRYRFIIIVFTFFSASTPFVSNQRTNTNTKRNYYCSGKRWPRSVCSGPLKRIRSVRRWRRTPLAFLSVRLVSRTRVSLFEKKNNEVEYNSVLPEVRLGRVDKTVCIVKYVVYRHVYLQNVRTSLRNTRTHRPTRAAAYPGCETCWTENCC